MSDIGEILKGKSKEEILEDLKSDKEFGNKDFLNMVLKIHPEKFDQCMEVLPLSGNYDIFEIVNAIMDDKQLECGSIETLAATIWCLELCGIHNSNIEFIQVNKKETGKGKNKKTTYKYPFTIKRKRTS